MTNNTELYNVWSQMPQIINGSRPWSMVAGSITAEQAEVYKQTYRFPLNIERAK